MFRKAKKKKKKKKKKVYLFTLTVHVLVIWLKKSVTYKLIIQTHPYNTYFIAFVLPEYLNSIKCHSRVHKLRVGVSLLAESCYSSSASSLLTSISDHSRSDIDCNGMLLGCMCFVSTTKQNKVYIIHIGPLSARQKSCR